MAEVKQNKAKGIRKSFFEVNAPMTATKIQLYAGSLEECHGKVVSLDLTRSLRGKNVEMKLKVSAEGDKLVAEPIGIELIGSYIRRMFRKGADYVEDSFNVEAKDAKVVVKTFMLTRNKVPRSIRNSLRMESKKYLESLIRMRTTKEMFNDIITNKVQRDLSLKLKKIYPLALCEIRVFKIIQEKK